jgi:hypothetical protein
MALLTELENVNGQSYYKDAAPNGAKQCGAHILSEPEDFYLTPQRLPGCKTLICEILAQNSFNL